MNPENLVDGASKASVASRVDDAERIQRLGAKIRALRKEHGLTLKVLAQLSGLSHPFLSQVERGLARLCTT